MDAKEIMNRIGEVRKRLLNRGLRCLSSGKFGLPSYTDVEAWAGHKGVLYLLYDRETGGWDILASVDQTNGIEQTWMAVDRFVGE